MKPVMTKTLIAVLLVGSSATAYAAGPYVGLNYSQYELKSDATNNTLNPTGATVRGGYEFNDIFALEARIGTGIEADTRSSGLGTAEFELDRIYGGYVKLSVPVFEMFRPYAIGGYSEARGRTSLRSGGILLSRDTDTEEGESYGLGVDASLGRAIGFNVEYMRYLDQNNYELNAVSAGIRSSF
jgi:outer membrane immunogenic protein